jgi:type IV secretion system protein VirB8
MSRSEPLLLKYWEEADQWDRDLLSMRVRSERNAWRIAVGACCLTLLSAASLLCLLPLKRVEPFVVRVDASTGIVDVVPAYEGTQQVDEVVTRYLLSQYVRSCEQFYLPSALSDYETCGAFNSPTRNQELYQRWTPSNPQSPLQMYRDGTTLHASVTSVIFLQSRGGGSPVAQVRYQIGKRNAGSGTEQMSYWIATLQYQYITPSHNARVRQLNPLGLRILDFRREPEVVDSRTAQRGGSAQGVLP